MYLFFLPVFATNICIKLFSGNHWRRGVWRCTHPKLAPWTPYPLHGILNFWCSLERIDTSVNHCLYLSLFHSYICGKYSFLANNDKWNTGFTVFDILFANRWKYNSVLVLVFLGCVKLFSGNFWRWGVWQCTHSKLAP